MILDQFRPDGKIAFVTNCKRGIGAAMAIALAEAGAAVIGVPARLEFIDGDIDQKVFALGSLELCSKQGGIAQITLTISLNREAKELKQTRSPVAKFQRLMRKLCGMIPLDPRRYQGEFRRDDLF